MNQDTRHRVIGTVVVLALALIFLPLVFDGDGSYQVPVTSRIPDAPAVRIMPEPIPQRPVITADSPEMQIPPADDSAVNIDPDIAAIPDPIRETEAAVSEPVDDTEADVPLSLGENGMPQGWSIRLASFSNPANAEALTQRLLAAGYRAYRRELDAPQGQFTAVYVGPQAERDKADALRAQLESEYQLAGIVVQFEVDSI